MFDFKLKERGVALFVVLATIFVVVLLANICLNIMVSQSRLTHHKVNRIQAYYAGWAVINYAQEELRRGKWTAPSVHFLPTDLSFPASVIQPIRIVLSTPGVNCAAPIGCSCVSVQIQYTNPTP